ncbi:unnamed protein product [Haemonchus placei]|uniref:Diguanylate cyclase n=1 Tax=Haemonchus placei TaxID=6290 RepID=A0A0N4W2C5_HAEPC|nr:unnamed protein product [Haemonchus placei]
MVCVEFAFQEATDLCQYSQQKDHRLGWVARSEWREELVRSQDDIHHCQKLHHQPAHTALEQVYLALLLR